MCLIIGIQEVNIIKIKINITKIPLLIHTFSPVQMPILFTMIKTVSSFI